MRGAFLEQGERGAGADGARILDRKGFCTITAVVSEALVETDGISIAVDGLFSSGLASAWGAGMFVCGGCAVLCSPEVPDCS